MAKQSGNGKWFRIVVEVVIVLFAIAAAWATLRNDVKENCEDLSKHDMRITAAEKTVTEIKGDVREIKVEQKYISKGIDEIKNKLN